MSDSQNMSDEVRARLRAIPSVNELLAEWPVVKAAGETCDAVVHAAVTAEIDEERAAIRAGAASRSKRELASAIEWRAHRSALPSLRPAVNATGVVIHTNLGRAPLAESAAKAVAEVARGYSTLEYSVDTCSRGSRKEHAAQLIRSLTGAEDALVVNNNAAAVLLVLATHAAGKEVIVSRGELVEIGGSFRIPDVMAASGAKLVEVGATNRTHLRDYENAVSPETAALLKVHTSNYRIVGFTKEVSLAELAELGARLELPVIEDLGSGNLTDFAACGLPGEPTVQQAVAEGADVVTFSGDKVLGGPQAGIIVGKAKYVAAIRKNPLNRAMRIDKMTLAALEATLRLYRDPERARAVIPTLAMITASPEALAKKARKLAGLLRKALAGRYAVSAIPGASRVGGGAYPERDLPTTLVALRPLTGAPSPDALRQRLLAADPPLVARTQDDALLLDPRTLADDELKLVATVLGEASRPETA